MRKYSYSLLMIICLIFAWSCSSTPKETMNLSVNGKIMVIQRNEQISLKLDLHADGGYKWDCKLSDSNIVKEDSTKITSNNIGKNIVGGILEETFYFSSVNTPGKCNITLIEHRGWEKDIPPANTVQFLVYVK